MQGLKPLVDIWSDALNSEEAFAFVEKSKKAKSATRIRLTGDEKVDLYEILSLDKVTAISESEINSNPTIIFLRQVC